MSGPVRLIPPPVVLRSGTFFHDPELDDIDPDIVTIGDYLAGELDEAQEDAIHERIADDPEYYEKVYPVIELWDRAAAADAATRSEASHARARQATRPDRTRRWLIAAGLVLIAGAAGAVAKRHVDRRSGVASMWLPVAYSSGDTVRAVAAPGGVVVTLSPHAEVTVERWHWPDADVLLALSGRASIVVPEHSFARLGTSEGSIALAPGRYAVADSAGEVHIKPETKPEELKR